MAVKSQYNIDPSRVFIVGFENGGFMAHRMACEHPEILAGIVSISGASFQNAADCKALNNNSVHHPNILQIAGRLDRVPTLNGGSFEGVTIPSMKTTAERWALHHGCVGDDSSVVPTSVVVDNALNFRTKLLANAPDTSTETWTCNATSACVENWVINGMNTDTAVPNSFTNGFSEAIIDWMVPTPLEAKLAVQASLDAGARDGISGTAEPLWSVDGMEWPIHEAMLLQIRAAVSR